MKKNKKTDWIWQGNAGHFIGAFDCHFVMNTYIPRSKVIVSTIGEYYPFSKRTHDEIGDMVELDVWGSYYETMVFDAKKCKCGCGSYVMKSPSEIDSKGYKSIKAATRGHVDLCNKWDVK